MSQPATEPETDEADDSRRETAPSVGSSPMGSQETDSSSGRHGHDPTAEDDARESSDETARSATTDERVLVITGLAHKNDRHYGPLAAVAGETTLVCLDPTTDIDGARHVFVPDVGPRILRVVALLFVALYEGYRNEYDAVVSISLVPYGIYALVCRAVYGYPAHLGIIGIDLDHHARRWYGPLPRWLFRRFDVVSVPGSDHAKRLARAGVDPDRIARLTNPIDIETYRPLEAAGKPPVDDRGDDDRPTAQPELPDTEYDFVWVGRFSAEKDPRRFVAALAALERSGYDVRAAMVGEGPLRSAVARDCRAYGLEDRVDLPGWVDDPLTYYRRSDAFVLTSKRDALPLVMLEAMATGLAPIVPRVGSIADVVTDGENGIVVPDREPATIAAAMARALESVDERQRLGANATDVRDSCSLERAATDWADILATFEERS
ncbi:glycosyltransferase [Salinadaptatus halalkaliphilus]|uniref:Glycosyltransferase n=1 Tax=Salinadaptatus halalkaliphilus TaxID=2419781 RepID=A0A4S3TPG0_9EURY|nr:glycosyltransferase [Salinadaptatus halalkaliphilus]THE66244.1 glycosyltransferase [Salinadaptatus halalkaliphilus]